MQDEPWLRIPPDPVTLAGGVRAAVGVGAGVARLATAAAVRPAAGMLRFGYQLLPGVPGHPRLARLAGRVDHLRVRVENRAADALRDLLRRAVEAALTALDLTELVRAHVDLDALAADLDVDAVIARADIAAVIARTDLDAIVQTIDLDAVVSRVDIEAIVDLVDLDRVASRIDLDAIVGRVDIDRVASKIDLDAILARVDPDSIVARVDVEAVLARLDLAAIASQVIEAIDLPGILRQSSGAVSSQAARAVRTEGMNADESVARFIDRLLRRPHPQGAVTA